MCSPTRKLAKDLINWYWRSGQQRTDLLLSSWVDRLYDVVDILGEIEASEACPKACMAIWGPSQTGKSTLISSYIDKGADAVGNDSALHWPGGSPARFVVENKDVEAVVLNPYRNQSDASGCVSRFVVRDEIPDVAHPVEIHLATETQIMHSLAMGYFSDCTVNDSTGGPVHFTPETFRKRWGKALKSQNAGNVQREAYEVLREFVDLLETLVMAGHERYEGLRQEWIVLRKEMLEDPKLLSGTENVRLFAADVLWDAKQPLTQLYDKFCELLGNLRMEWQNKPAFCSLDVAAILLDIGACQKLQSSASMGDDQYKLRALSLGWKSGNGVIQIGPGYALDARHQLVKSDEDFGLFQGLVRELLIPLRRDKLAANSPILCQFLESADLLDFPGVANAYKKVTDVRIDLDALKSEESYKLFTDVVKRGKTASIVMKYAETLGIDGFSIMTKWGRFPAQPDQLISGIKAWWKNFDPTFLPGKTAETRHSPLPYNLVLTFCSDIVSDVIRNGIASGLETTFKEQIGALGPLADPQVVTQTFATNYLKFSRFTDQDKTPLPGSHPQVQKAREAIENDPAFTQQFCTQVSRDSFKAMIEDGGTDFLFRELRNQAAQSGRRALLALKKKQQVENLKALIKDACPPNAGYQDNRKKELLEWKRSLENSLICNKEHEAGVTVMSHFLRHLVNVDGKVLNPIPLNLARNTTRRKEDAVSYWDKQFQAWREVKLSEMTLKSKGMSFPDGFRIPAYGINDEAHLGRLLRYLMEAVPMEGLRDWLLEHFGDIHSEQAAEINRRYIAVKMTSALFVCQSEAPRTHRNAKDIQTELVRYADHELEEPYDYRHSPHYCAFIGPLLSRIEEAVGQNISGTRPAQPGDTELLTSIRSNPIAIQELALQV